MALPDVDVYAATTLAFANMLSSVGGTYVPVTFAPFTYAVLPETISPAAAVASDVYVPVTCNPSDGPHTCPARMTDGCKFCIKVTIFVVLSTYPVKLAFV